MEEISHKLDEITANCKALTSDLAFVKEMVKEKFEKEKVMLQGSSTQQDSRVQLDVGGVIFSTSISTLQKVPDTMFSAMFSGRHSLTPNKDGSFFIDRDGTHFRWILNYLRDPESINLLKDENVLAEVELEAKYYCISPLVEYISLKLAGGLRSRTASSVYHIHFNDAYLPDDSLLQNKNIKITRLHRFTNWATCKVTCDTILVTIIHNVETENLGNFLANFVDNGGNVVLCSHFFPKGRFSSGNYNPLVTIKAQHSDDALTLGKVYYAKHPLMQGVHNIRINCTDLRVPTTTLGSGDVERIADWNNGIPMAATRTDKRGLITSISFIVGQHGAQGDAVRMVQNALSLSY